MRYKLFNINKVGHYRVMISFLLSLCLASCVKDSNYAQYKLTAEKAINSGKRVDTLFFGLHLGMTTKEFYGHCWEMNKKGLFTDGEGNTTVLYRFRNNEFEHPVSMNFYPDFHKDKIYKMDVSYQYDAWAPWNKHLFADKLLLEVLEMYKKWYSNGTPFIKIEDKTRGTIYVKVDGNRRIIIGRYDDVKVKVDYTDLLIEEEI